MGLWLYELGYQALIGVLSQREQILLAGHWPKICCIGSLWNLGSSIITGLLLDFFPHFHYKAQLANLSLLTTISCILKLLRDATSHIALVDHRATLTQGHFIIILFYTIQYPLYCTLEFKEAIIMAFNNDYTATILSLSGFEVELEKDLNDFAREEQSLVRFLSLVAIAMLSSYIKFFPHLILPFQIQGFWFIRLCQLALSSDTELPRWLAY